MAPNRRSNSDPATADNAPNVTNVDPELLQAALDYVTLPKGKGSRKHMERLIQEAVASYRNLSSAALLWSKAREELNDIKRAADNFLKHLRRASAFSVSRLGTSTTLQPLFQKAYDADGSPIQSRRQWDDIYEHGASGSQMRWILEDLSDTAAKEAKELYVPRGGPGGHFPERNHPTRELVRG